MAMSQAANLFDQKQSQGLAQGNKSDAMEQAGQAVMKLMMKHQVSTAIWHVDAASHTHFPFLTRELFHHCRCRA